MPQHNTSLSPSRISPVYNGVALAVKVASYAFVGDIHIRLPQRQPGLHGIPHLQEFYIRNGLAYHTMQSAGLLLPWPESVELPCS